MKNLFVLLFAILSCSGNSENKTKSHNDNNIVIKSPEFKTVIKNFYKDALYYSPYAKNDTISVSFYQYKDHDKIVNVGLYSFKKLEGKYIGESNLDSLKILFYTDNIKITKDFIELKFVKEETINKQDHKQSDHPPIYKETYEKFYSYKDGKLTLMRLK
ncbi:hypothetical protein EG347_02575 [Chryseobacterium sp. G0186]|uniref:hypothetical protein n=1 Tax=Chryseobacterium sp. G0186 TaxID=2487064 RepID=UPI000F508669|nr:hypothetical protein [Chryseobacterium sp. G0186]AZA76485.1 hypothetical protein EG347_02575 [Chryseobacterium sp. G0186]